MPESLILVNDLDMHHHHHSLNHTTNTQDWDCKTTFTINKRTLPNTTSK